MAKVIDGCLIANEIKNKAALDVIKLKKLGVEVCLAVVYVGFNAASEIYIKNKAKACESLQIKLKCVHLSESISKEEFVNTIKRLNSDCKVNGILIQLPLPPQLNDFEFFDLINPAKDVDGFCAENVGRLFLGRPCLTPCTAAGVVFLLDHEKINLSGLCCAVVGKSNIVGKPLSLMLMQKNATVVVCCSKTVNLSEMLQKSDVVVSAAGSPKLIKASMVKEGAIVVDVGINRLENGKICGDVDFEEVKTKARLITPVPGGVGPLTVAKLMKNVVDAAKMQHGFCEI